MNKLQKGFTLVELLVVIAIIAVLAAVVVLVVNPAELTARSRDAVRMADVGAVASAINLVVSSATDVTPLSMKALLCSQDYNASQTYCTGSSATDPQLVDGTGWVAVNFAAAGSVAGIGALPKDPGTQAYTYKATGETPAGYQITAVFESDQYDTKMGTDGGNDGAAYEVGSKIQGF